MAQSQKQVDAIRRAWENAYPELAAEKAARQFEFMGIEIPDRLTVDPPVGELYREVVMAGPNGITVAELRAGESVLGARADAIRRLRRSGCVTERQERRANRRGRLRRRVVLVAKALTTF